MKLRFEMLGLFLALSACSGDKVAIGSDALDVDGGGAGGSGSGAGGDAGRAGSGGSGTEGGGGSGNQGSGGSSASGICRLPIASGDCLAYMPSWGFDTATQRCVPFVYGGCEGNANRFASATDCVAQCGGDICQPQAAEGVGPCDALLGIKWNGTTCVVISGCSCAGPDCDNLFSTGGEDCMQAHAQCPGLGGCLPQRNALEGFIGDNKECTTTDDCQIAFGGCGVTEDDCTNAVYVNKRTDLQQLDRLRAALDACHPEECGSGCDRALVPPECIEGSCSRAQR
jgi:hypothetical protein